MNIAEKYNGIADGWFYGLFALVLLIIECISLYSIPTSKYLEEQGTLPLLPVEVVRKSTTSRRYHISSKFYVKYGVENYFTYEKAEDAIAAKSTVSMQVEKPYTLYISTKDPEVYRLVKSGSTLKKTLSEERNPHLTAGVIWLTATIWSVRRIIMCRD
ncbi:MAG: hypothetical protein R3Y63_12355 [Eubacteriales bacterium]